MEKINLVKYFYAVMMLLEIDVVVKGVYTVARPSDVVGFTYFVITLVTPTKLA